MKTLSEQTNDALNLFAENIYTLYINSGMTMDDFAEEAELNRSTVYQWTQHKVAPVLASAWKVCEHYGVNIYDMCTKRMKEDGTFE